MNLLITIIVSILLVAGAVALFVYYDKIVALLFGSIPKKPTEDLNISNDRVAGVLDSELTAYILSIVVGAVLSLGNLIGGSFLLGFHGFWSSFCTLIPLLLFASFSLHVYYILESEERTGRIVGRIVFLSVACVFGFFAGALAMILIFLVLCLFIAFFIFGIVLGGGGKDKSDTVEITGPDIIGKRTAKKGLHDYYYDEYGQRWKKNTDGTMTEL